MNRLIDYLGAIALFALCLVIADMVLDRLDPCFDSHTDTCVELKGD